MVFEDTSLSWQELWQAVKRASCFLSAKVDSGKQEIITLLLPNSDEFIISYLAVLHSGHIAMPLDPAYKKLEIEAIISQVPPKLIITNDAYMKLLDGLDDEIVRSDQLQNHSLKNQPIVRLKPDKQVASLTFTSGTTGKPKAVPNTHTNHLWNIKVCSKVWEWTDKDSLLINLPLSHWYGIVMGIAGVVYHGNTFYIHRWFDEVKTLEALSSDKISLYSHTSPAFIKLLQTSGDYDLSSLRVCIAGGAALPPAVWHDFKHRFGIELTETYGSSETGRIAANDLNRRVLGSPGKVLPEVNFKLSSDDEVLIKSAGVFPGYYKNPEATKQSMTDDGYWRTGDLAELKDGYVFLKGRTQERIRRFGYTISPRDVEWAMYQNPEIKDIYVMGIQRADQPNDELIYFMVTDLDEKKIRQYAKVNLIFAWRPDKIIKMPDLPRTRSAKPRINELKKIAERSK